MTRKSYSAQATLDATFLRIINIDENELELRADYSRYLCVLVSGFLEQSVRLITADYARCRAQPQIADFVIEKTDRLTNLTCEKLAIHFSSLNKEWVVILEKILVNEAKEAINSVVSLRHLIAHGKSADITLARLSKYYTEIKKVLKALQEMTK